MLLVRRVVANLRLLDAQDEYRIVCDINNLYIAAQQVHSKGSEEVGTGMAGPCT